MSTARVLTRVLPLALVVATGSAVTAQAQTLPWPSTAPQQPPPSAPWPTQPAGPAPAAAMPAPSAPGMMTGPGPTPEQQECLRNFTGYRQEVEKRARAAQAESKKKPPPTRERMCELVTAYSAAEFKWLKYSEANLARCGIPKDAVVQIKAVHAHTLDAKKKLCSAGPNQAAAPSAPSLSDALSSSLAPPADERSKHKVGGTMDTLTGNVLTR